MGVFHEAGEAIKDLFRHERITIIDENGQEVTKVVKPEPLQNPITLLRMLTWKACAYADLRSIPSPPRDAHPALLQGCSTSSAWPLGLSMVMIVSFLFP